jgi:K+-sensing histidine kinase KdpD
MDNEQLRLLFFEEADVLFQIYDKDLNVIDVNKATLRLFNIEKSSLIGKNIKDLSPESVTSGRYDAYLEVIRTGKTLIIDELKIWPNNKEVYLRVKAFKVGTGLGMVTKNITDLELKIRKTAAELELKVNSLDEANKHITGMMKVLATQNTQLNDFCNIVSHNLRAPLINLSILNDFINDCEDQSEKDEMFKKIDPVIKTLTETFDNLVESIQIKDETEIPFEINNFEALTNKILEKHLIEIELYKATIQCDFNEAPQIFYPKKYLDSILSNLISNALKYRSPHRNPIIQIKTEIIENKICLKVSDNGLGIDLKINSKHMFKMRKVFHDNPDAKGYGLFLTNTQVEAMEGKIKVESAPNLGTTFTVEFHPKNNII